VDYQVLMELAEHQGLAVLQVLVEQDLTQYHQQQIIMC
jgi:hypothetical protein